jgi:hypothetical protein
MKNPVSPVEAGFFVSMLVPGRRVFHKLEVFLDLFEDQAPRRVRAFTGRLAASLKQKKGINCSRIQNAVE